MKYLIICIALNILMLLSAMILAIGLNVKIDTAVLIGFVTCIICNVVNLSVRK